MNESATAQPAEEKDSVLVLYGAFDRYNFGDNLMPILLHWFILAHRPDILRDSAIEFCSISRSDLSRFDCVRTKSMKDIKLARETKVSIVVVGGEVLNTTNRELFLNMQNSRLGHSIARLLAAVLRWKLKPLLTRIYGADWEYPWIIPKKRFAGMANVIYNTVGGTIVTNNITAASEIAERLQAADYISTRDRRTFDSVSHVTSCELSPDFVTIAPSLVEDASLLSRVKTEVLTMLPDKYICFQASPHKAGSSVNEVAKTLLSIADRTKMEIVLLPIGYASGHDDSVFLRAVNRAAGSRFKLLDRLTLWEIYLVLRKSSLYIGTSLHGAVVSMSYGIPHIGLNRSIEKLQAYLSEWSISPFDTCYSLEEIEHVATEALSQDLDALERNAERLVELTRRNSLRMMEFL